jgi:hypothetical protein
MHRHIFLLLFLVLYICSPAWAQNKYYDDFQDTVRDYYGIHQRRHDYLKEYINNRLELDKRRVRFEAARQEDLQNYYQRHRKEDKSVDYDAGMADY